LLHLVRRSPRAYGHKRNRWSLPTIRASCAWLQHTSLGGVARVLKRLRIHRKRARDYIHSPDPHYTAKLAEVARVRDLARQQPGQIIVVFMDEVTIYRQPTLSSEYEAAGADGPRAKRSLHSDSELRVVATLCDQDGRVVFRRANKITIETLIAFFQQLCAAYPEAQRIYVVQDNWPVHIHPDVLVALEPQETTFTRALPPSWSSSPSAAAVRKWGQLKLPIQLVPLPTYASWTNPIEKLWRLLRQEHLHLHQLAEDLTKLRELVDEALGEFANGSSRLLRYVGLEPCTD
jgi:hypothetical protein